MHTKLRQTQNPPQQWEAHKSTQQNLALKQTAA